MTDSVTTILLARHGETDWNRERRWQGHADLPLNPVGREQAEALAAALEEVAIAAVYASDLRRARETAAVVAERKRLAVTALRELREVDVGSWTGRPFDEVRVRVPDAYRRMRTRAGRGWEGGETYSAMGERVLQAIGRIAREHSGERVLVVTHSGPIRAVRAHAAGLDYSTDRKAAPRLERGRLVAVTVSDGVFAPAEAASDVGAGTRWA